MRGASRQDALTNPSPLTGRSRVTPARPRVTLCLLCRLGDAKLRAMVAMAIEAEKLARRYGRRWALAGVTFDVPKGAVVMIAGPNGSGKATFLRHLSTALPPPRRRAPVTR